MCLMCGAPFCEECARLTDYGGLCVSCESKKQRRILSYASKKRNLYLSNALAFFIGALIFLAASFIFADFRLAGTIGVCVLGGLSFIFFILTADRQLACKKAAAKAEKLEAALKDNRKG